MDHPAWLNKRTAAVMDEIENFMYHMDTSNEEGWISLRNWFNFTYSLKMDASSKINIYQTSDTTQTMHLHIVPRGHKVDEFVYSFEHCSINFIYFTSLKDAVLFAIRNLFPLMIHNLDVETAAMENPELI